MEKQAQVGDPEVVALHEGANLYWIAGKEPFSDEDEGFLITLQSHREAMSAVLIERDLARQNLYEYGEIIDQQSEAIAKKDAALKACVEIIRIYRNDMPLGHQPHMVAHKADAAITQAQEALK